MKNNINNNHNKQNKQKGLHMKTNKLVFLAALCAVVLFGTTSAFAAGTAAGTVIKNVASMTYKDTSGVSFPTLYSDTASVAVEKVTGVTLTPSGSLQYSSDSMYVYFPHTVTNTGNDTNTIGLYTADNGTLNWGPRIFPDLNNSNSFDAADTAGGTVATTGSLAADGSYKILIRVFVPNGVVSGLLDTVQTAAISTYNNGIDPVSSASSRDSIRTRVPEVALTKTNTNGTPHPGDVISYTINYINNGTGRAENSTLTDSLDDNVTYNADPVIVGGGVVNFLTSPNRVVWSNIGGAGNIVGGATGSLTFSVTVNAGVSSGTIIANHAYLNYTDSISGRTKKPIAGPTTSTVSQTASWDIKVATTSMLSHTDKLFTTDNDADSVNVSLAIYYKIKLKNTGNRTDTAVIARTTSFPLTWTLYKDVNKNGVYDSETDVVYDLAGNTGGVAQNDSIMFIAVDTIAQNAADRGRDSANYHVASLTAGASDSAWTITRIKAPVMTLTKSVVGVSGRSRPGDTLEYTITYTNTGSGSSSLVVITDASPVNTTLQTDGYAVGYAVKLNGVNKSNTADGDEVTVSGSSLTISLGTLGSRLMGDANHTGTIKFRVTIN